MQDRRPFPWAWVFFCLTVAVLIAQAVSLYDRGKDGESDIGVFYRSARLLREGAGGEVYAQRDSVTGWPISIPPAGMALLQPFAALDPAAATALWAAFNVLVALLAVVALRRVLLAVELQRPYPWLAGVFLLLAGGSLQVGQFSLLFASSWIFALYLAQLRPALSQLMWAMPAAIKLYPALLFFAPLSGKERFRSTAWLIAWLLVLAFLLPLPFYGLRTWDLNVGFFNEIVLDPGGRLKWMQALGTTANQSLDAVLIRYIGWYPKFHEHYTSVPTARLDLDTVRLIGHLVRAVLLAVTVWATVRYRRSAPSPDATSLLVTAALWSSALYVALPETRARYAVYAFLGFVPFALYVIQSTSPRQRTLRAACFAAVLLLVMGLIPKPLEVAGVGFLGVAALWAFNVHWLTARPSQS